MKNDTIENNLHKISNQTNCPAPNHLCANIKKQLDTQADSPAKPKGHINIVIDLRINKYVAAAAIIISTIMFANLLNLHSDRTLYSETKIVLQSLLHKNSHHADFSDFKKLCEKLKAAGHQIEYLGDTADRSDPDSILMYTKLADGNFSVRFINLRTEIFTSQELIAHQTKLLQKKSNK